MTDGADLFNQLIQNPFPSNQPANQYQGLQALSSAPSNALAQGNVLLKITCGEEIRCRSVSEDYGWEDLQYMVQQMFQGEISPRDPILLRFKDSDGDWVTMASEDEFNLAKQLSPKLHICVSQKTQAKPNVHIPQLRKTLVRLREEINSLLELLPTTAVKEEGMESSPPIAQPRDSKKQVKEVSHPESLNSVLDALEDTKLARTVSPQAPQPTLPTLPTQPTQPTPPVTTEPPRQYSNLGKLPTNIMPNSGQIYVEQFGVEQHGLATSHPSVAPVAPPVLGAFTQPSAPTTVPSASTLFPAQNIPFNVPQPPYPPQAYPPSAPGVPYSSGYYPHYPK